MAEKKFEKSEAKVSPERARELARRALMGVATSVVPARPILKVGK